MSIKEAFFSICEDAKPANEHFVSLYVQVPYYGGPEEGGWWGHDTSLIAYHHVSSDEEATAVKEKVQELAKELSDEARRTFGEQCLREMEWLESRGLDADWLGEVDGEEEYFVTIEETPGSLTSQGCRHYC